MSDATTPAWLNRRAPKLTHAYPAWATDPTAATEQRVPRGYHGIVVLVLAMVAAAMLVSWWLK